MTAYKIHKQLPSGEQVRKELPLSPELAQQVLADQEEIKAILRGEDKRMFLIVGPCSAWPSEAVVEYAQKLKPLADKVSDKIKIVMRCYLQKPRTTVGWLGAMNQVDPYKDPDIEAGIYYSRKMMLDVLNIGLPLADEAVFTHNDGYVADLLSWIAIGARSSEDQEHRIFASMVGHPVGLKNPTSGRMKIAVNSLVAAQAPHVFAIHREQVETSGNPYAHLILRGGDESPNYSFEDLQKAVERLREANLQNPAIVVDASHSNCMDPSGQKCFDRQPGVVMDVLDSMQKDPEIKNHVKGFMVESFLKSGAQKLSDHSSVEDLKYGLSVTDGCIGWEETERFIEEMTKRL